MCSKLFMFLLFQNNNFRFFLPEFGRFKKQRNRRKNIFMYRLNFFMKIFRRNIIYSNIELGKTANIIREKKDYVEGINQFYGGYGKLTIFSGNIEEEKISRSLIKNILRTGEVNLLLFSEGSRWETEVGREFRVRYKMFFLVADIIFFLFLNNVHPQNDKYFFPQQIIGRQAVSGRVLPIPLQPNHEWRNAACGFQQTRSLGRDIGPTPSDPFNSYRHGILEQQVLAVADQ